jgi:hypothetical protein
MRAVERDGGEGKRVGGVLNPQKGLGPAILDFVHPVGGIDSAPALNRAVLRMWIRGARLMDQALA